MSSFLVFINFNINVIFIWHKSLYGQPTTIIPLNGHITKLTTNDLLLDPHINTLFNPQERSLYLREMVINTPNWSGCIE